MPSPVPAQSWCTNSNFDHCRVYTNYVNRMYFIVVHAVDTNCNQISFNPGTTAGLPPAKEFNSTNNNYYIAWVEDMDSYYQYYTYGSRDHSQLLAKAPTIAAGNSLYSTNLAGTSGTLLYTLSMSSETLYGWYKRGPYAGSVAKMVVSGMTINGCAVWITDRLNPVTYALFCTVSGSTVTITARSDITSSGTLYLVVQTNSVPSSYTATFTLYDKYRGSSDYSTTISSSKSSTRTNANTVLNPNYIVWRRQTYKQLKTDTSPIVYTFSAPYDYVYNEATPANSNNIIVTYPAASGISSGLTYYCILKEYTAGAYHLYNEWLPKCEYATTNQIRIWAIPGHILSSAKTYEITIYKVDNANNNMFAVPSTNTYNALLTSYTATTPIFQSQVAMRKYQAVNPITISSMYILTEEAGVANSLCLTFTINTAGTAAQELEFKFTSLGLSSFQVNSGGEIPCWISSTGFSAISGRSVKCIASSPGINADTPLYIRVVNFNSFTSGTSFKLAFDRFTNPSPNSLILVPMDVTIAYFDMVNYKYYETIFQEIYTSDSVNINSNPTDLNSGYTPANNVYGTSTYHYMNFNWPYNSGNTISEKTMLRMSGGITCCQSFTSFSVDAQSTAFTILWANSKANVLVMRTPSLSIAPTNMRIFGVINPYPYQVSLYNSTREIEIVIYSSYKRVAFDYVTQYPWSSFAQTGNSMNLYTISGPYHKTGSNQIHSAFAATYDFTFNFTANDFSARKITYCVVVFTAGVGTIEAAYSWVTGISPYYINNVGNVKYFYSGGYWKLNITGIPDSTISTGQYWVVRLRFYPTGSTITYTSTAYCYNGITEFTNSNSVSISGDYNSSNVPATSFFLSQRRYFTDFYELQNKPIYPAAGATSRRLIFRFTAAYSVSEA